MLKIPFDRVVTFILPYVSVAAGALSSWLFTNVHFLGLFTSVNGLTSAIIAAVIFALTTGAAELGRNGWLKGRRIELEGIERYQQEHGSPWRTVDVVDTDDPNTVEHPNQEIEPEETVADLSFAVPEDRRADE